jgi:hypothetical protein
LRKITIFSLIAYLLIVAGCSSPSGNMLLSVDFPQDETLTYKFKTNRNVVLNLEGEPEAKKSGKDQKTTEGIEMVVAYTPKGTDLYGNTTIEAVCKSINANRQTFTSRSDAKSDAVNHLKGKSWTFSINPAGEIQDYSQMHALAEELGARAITESGKRRIKDPDLIWDFVATQWFMWDELASNKNLHNGVDPGQSWKSILPVPFAVRLPAERHVRYTVDPQQSPDDPVVTILSSYELRSYEQKGERLVFDSALPQMPKPYEGSFQTKGMFGFLRDYKAESLTGEGVAKYNMDSGILLIANQKYEIDMTAGFMFPLGNTTPVLKIDQTIDVELVDE